MRHLSRLGLLTPDARQAPFAEFRDGRWRIWQSFNADVSSGSYVDLQPTGQADLVTVKDGQVLDITILTGPVDAEVAKLQAASRIQGPTTERE